MKKKPLGKGKYVKAKTPEAKQKRTAAIIGYYTKKRKEEKQKKALVFVISLLFRIMQKRKSKAGALLNHARGVYGISL